MYVQEQLQIQTRGRGTIEITHDLQKLVATSSINVGLCHAFVKHTSASLIICENADPSVRYDLEVFMEKTVPDGDPIYRHDAEGPDDMPAHIRTILSEVSLIIPVRDSRCQLGTWQGIYLWEHRTAPHTRKIVLTVTGD